MTAPTGPSPCPFPACDDRGCYTHAIRLFSRTTGWMRTLSYFRTTLRPHVTDWASLAGLQTTNNELRLLLGQNSSYRASLLNRGIDEALADDMAYDHLRNELGMFVYAAENVITDWRAKQKPPTEDDF